MLNIIHGFERSVNLTPSPQVFFVLLIAQN